MDGDAMRAKSFALVVLLLALFLGCASSTAPSGAKTARPPAPSPAEKLSVTKHSIRVAGATLDYTATAGFIELKDDAGKPKASVFFVAYVKDEPGAGVRRPVTFAFNGGPGAASMWLHLGALGPRRAEFGDDGMVLPRSLKLVDNEYTWLTFTDLVFIDPVGTGFSRPAPGVDARQFWGVKGDTESVGDFIRLYVTRYDRWLSPKFLCGESYGATRAALLAERLQDHVGMSLSGVVLLSSVLDFLTIRFDASDLPCALYLPSYAAAAWYHKKLPKELQELPLSKVLEESQAWALREYLPALTKGDALSDADRAKIAGDLARYTGLPLDCVLENKLRVSNRRFAKEVMHGTGRVLGLMDGRVTGFDVNPFNPYPDYDPSFYIVSAPLASCANDYLRRELKFETDLAYEFLSNEANRSWSWGIGGQGFVSVGDKLQEAMTKNNRLKALFGWGWYDLNVGYFAQEYGMTHLDLPPGLRGNVTWKGYPAGHQMYTDLGSLKQLRSDAEAFFHFGF
jgi:carboxypeptidase C (cathepsin A)